MPKDFHTYNENYSASETAEDATIHKQEKIKKLKCTLDSMLGKGDQLRDRDVTKEDREEKKKYTINTQFQRSSSQKKRH
jgi:hypothetical protein